MALQRIQVPTNPDVRRLNAITRKLQKEPQKLMLQAMKCLSQVDIHADSGYRRLDTAVDVRGYGMRRLTLLRRGKIADGRDVVHLLDSVCKSHRLVTSPPLPYEMQQGVGSPFFWCIFGAFVRPWGTVLVHLFDPGGTVLVHLCDPEGIL